MMPDTPNPIPADGPPEQAVDPVDHAQQLLAWAHAFELVPNRQLTVDEIAQVSGDDLVGDLKAASVEIGRLRRAIQYAVDVSSGKIASNGPDFLGGYMVGLQRALDPNPEALERFFAQPKGQFMGGD
jgi:hypothetical protein